MKANIAPNQLVQAAENRGSAKYQRHHRNGCASRPRNASNSAADPLSSPRTVISSTLLLSLSNLSDSAMSYDDGEQPRPIEGRRARCDAFLTRR